MSSIHPRGGLQDKSALLEDNNHRASQAFCCRMPRKRKMRTGLGHELRERLAAFKAMTTPRKWYDPPGSVSVIPRHFGAETQETESCSTDDGKRPPFKTIYTMVITTDLDDLVRTRDGLGSSITKTLQVLNNLLFQPQSYRIVIEIHLVTLTEEKTLLRSFDELTLTTTTSNRCSYRH